MKSLVYSTVAAAAKVIGNLAGELVEYRRGGVSAMVQAVHAPKPYEALAENGLVVTFQSEDWLIVAADLTAAFAALDPPVAIGVPQAGDQVRQTADEGQGTQVLVHEVCNVPGGNCYDLMGECRYRIHSKADGTEAAT